MKITKENMRQKIIIFNNEYLAEYSTNTPTKRESIIPYPDIFEEEIELNLILENGENINFKCNLNEDIYSKVDNFCKKNNISQDVHNLILEQIDSKIAELMEKKRKKIDNNQIAKDNLKNKNKLKNNNKTFVQSRQRKGEEIGRRLYEKGIKFNLRKEKNIEKMRAELLKNKPKYNFKPKLSKKTQELTRNNNQGKIKIEDRLITLGNEREKKILRKIAEKKFLEESKRNDLSLTNHKNKKSKIKRNKSEDVFNKLYKQKKIFDQKKETNINIYLKKNCPFKPNITKMAKNMKNDKYNDIIKKYNDKQQLKNKKILQERKNNIKKITSEINYENNSKQNIYIPINIKNRNKTFKNAIRCDLYNPKTEENSKNDFNEKYYKEIEEEKKKTFDKKAKIIMKKMKEHKFKNIFDSLDVNKKGFLSYANISFTNIEQNILDAISPVIGELYRNKNKRIYFNEFKNLTSESLSKCMMESE